MNDAIACDTYRLVRVKGQKRITLSVKSNGDVVVRAPKIVPKYTVDAFVLKNKDWIKNKLESAVTVKDGSSIGEIDIKVSLSSTTKITLEYNHAERELVLYCPERVARADKSKAVKDFLIKKSKASYPDMVHELAKSINQNVNKVYIKTASSRWGSCSSKKNINISAYTFALPQNLQHYIISHEVAHLDNMNHSKEFWELTAKLHPDYKASKKQLKEYGNLLGSL